MSDSGTVALDRNGRLMEAAAALLLATPSREMQITNLNKALFYLDLYALRDLGHTISQNAFVALREGPVVAKYDKRLVGQLQQRGIAQQIERGNAKPVVLVKAPDAWHFVGALEKAIAEIVAPKIAAMTAADVSNLSHENPGWRIAYNRGLGAGNAALPIDMNIALQEIVDDDPWLTEPLAAELSAALQAADTGEGEAW